jgi:hypothetical protein
MRLYRGESGETTMASEAHARQIGTGASCGASVRSGARPLARRSLAALVALVCLALSWSAPAWASSQRGHSFAFAFGEPGSGDGQFASPSGVAVDEQTGELYVSDTENNRVEQFEPERDAEGAIVGYRFVSAWGWGVADGEKQYEVCTSGCLAGLKGAREGQFDKPGQIAVDNSTSSTDPSRGDVYVLANHIDEKSTVEKFSSDGAYLGRVTSAEESEYHEVAEGVAVDANGLVWVDWEDDEITLYGNGTPNVLERELGIGETAEAAGWEAAPLRPGLAVTSSTVGASGHQDHLYLNVEPNGEAKEGKGKICHASPCVTTEIDAFDVAVTAQEQAQGIHPEEEEQVVESELSPENTTGVATDAANQDVYLDNATGLAAFDADGAPIQRFGGAEGGSFEGLRSGAGVAIDHAAGAEVGDVFAADAASGTIDVFQPASPGPPAVDGLSTHDVTSTSARLEADVDPDGAPTTYAVQYDTAACTGSQAACAESFTCTGSAADCGETPVPPASAGEAFGDRSVAVDLSGLAPATTYYYRFVASNGLGKAISGEERSFSTPPVTGKFIADERGWEQVSPVDKAGAMIQSLTAAGGAIQAAADGSVLAYVADATVGEGGEGDRSPEVSQVVSVRGEDGWSSRDIATPSEHGTGVELGYTEYQSFSSDLSLALVAPFLGGGSLAEPPLSPRLPGEEKQEKTVYLRADRIPPAQPAPGASPAETTSAGEAQAIYRDALENGEAMGNTGYVPLVNGVNAPGVPFGPLPGNMASGLQVAGVTPSLSHVVLRSIAPLKQNAAAGENLYEWQHAEGLGQGGLQLINVLPGAEEASASNPVLGGLLQATGRNIRHAISDDGTRVFWSAQGHLYMRDTGIEPAQTIQLDKAQGVAEPTRGAAFFQTASADGSRVFFTDEEPLTPGSGASLHQPDLYACEVIVSQTTGEPEGCKLSDLTPLYETPAHESESADVQGLVLGASSDGSAIYFISNGVLSTRARDAGATRGRCRKIRREEVAVPGATCSLYLERYDSAAGSWEEPTFVAALSNEDEPDWEGPGNGGDLGEVTSQVSANGRFLAFMSEQRLTGYDNEDVTSERAGERPDEEVFLYDAGAGPASEDGLVCASCDPSGARPVGVFDPPGIGEGTEGLGMLVDRPQTWAGRWLSASVPGWTKISREYAFYQSRYLSNSGRLLFDSNDALVPEDHNGKEDVYEYEPLGVPRGRHQCTGASPTYSAHASGCIGLISSGSAETESAFLDASQTGGEGPSGEDLSEGAGDVFFLTSAPLVPQDTDATFDVYDAHECTGESPCITAPEEKPKAVCETSELCRPYTQAPGSSPAAPASATPGSVENLTAQHKVLSTKAAGKPKPLTRAQKLSKALKACRAKHEHSRRERAACERQAHRRYTARATKREKVHRGASSKQARATRSTG